MTQVTSADHLDQIEQAALRAAGETQKALACLLAALRAVLDEHQPVPPASSWDMVSWVTCTCQATEVTTRIDGLPSTAPAEYPCPTIRAVTNVIGGVW